VEVTEFITVSRRQSFSPGAGLPGRVWASGEPVWIADLAREFNFVRAPAAAKAGLHRAIGFPIRLGNQTLGVLEFFGREIQPPDEDLLNMMAALGSQIGQFIERKRAEGESTQLAAIVESSDDAIIGATLDHIIIHWNAGAERIYGYLADEAEGQSILILSPPERHHEAPELFQRIKRGEQVDHFETVRVRKDGQHINVSLTISPIKDAAGRITGVSMIARDITERKQAEEALRESEAKFRVIAESAAALMFIHQGANYLYANPTAEAITGYTREELLAMNFWDIVHPDFQELVRGRGFARLKEEPVPSPYEIKIITKNGEERWVEIAVGACHFKGKPAALGTAYDVTQRKRVEEEHAQLLIREQQARKEAEAANRAKDEFLAMISHELRTPMTAIQGWARLLRAGQLDATTSARALEAIERNAHSQAQLIEELLDVSRIIMGKLRLQIRPVELASIIRVIIEATQPAADAKSIHIVAALDPATGPVSCDLERIQQVIQNLLANAVKFTPSGGRVEIRLERADPYVQITVNDTGPGISAEFLPHIFDRFSQEESARSYGGLGLGLAIVRHLVELHKGTIQAQSPGKGQGTTFTLKLPRTQPGMADLRAHTE
jgi:PAS domain S-box-containing protein